MKKRSVLPSKLIAISFLCFVICGSLIGCNFVIVESPSQTPAPISTQDAEEDEKFSQLQTLVAYQMTQIESANILNQANATQIAHLWEIVSYQATQVMALGRPPTTQVYVPTPYSSPGMVSGSIEIEDGRCCAGGTTGETIELSVEFVGASGVGDVSLMRVRTGNRCYTEDDLLEVLWEPFVPEKLYPFRVIINWVGFYVSVQYQDDQGNLSPIYCDDISIEGNPPTPTP